MIEVIRGIAKRIDEAKAIFDSTADWEIKYDAIFGMKIAQEIRDAGFTLEWYDPDTTYEEDVTAYMNALLQFRENLGDLIEED